MAPRNDLHSLSIEGLSVALCLLPDKRSTTYEELFESLKDAAMANDKEFNPKPIITHYASALLPIIESEVSVDTVFLSIRQINDSIYLLVFYCSELWIYALFQSIDRSKDYRSRVGERISAGYKYSRLLSPAYGVEPCPNERGSKSISTFTNNDAK